VSNTKELKKRYGYTERELPLKLLEAVSRAIGSRFSCNASLKVVQVQRAAVDTRTWNLPGRSATKSVALYWSPNAWRPTTIGLFQPGTRRGMFFNTMGSRKTVPLSTLRMVPLGERHICFSPNSATRAASGVMVAHLTPTLHCWMACAASSVTLSSVASRCGSPRSK
jgi:hypothetical protein